MNVSDRHLTGRNVETAAGANIRKNIFPPFYYQEAIL